MDPGKPKRRIYQCSPRKKRVRAHKSEWKQERRDRLTTQLVSDWRSSCLGYTRRYL